MQEWFSVWCGLLATVGLLAFVCLVMSVFIQISESGHKNHTHSPSRIFKDGLDDVLNELEDRCEKENDKMINNLNEAISHAREVAEKARNDADSGYFDEDKCLECAKEHEQLADWLEELKARREADRWIPVGERLPDKNGNYLVCLNNGEITTDIFEEEELFMGFWGYMTAWKPLPEAYKENEK